MDNKYVNKNELDINEKLIVDVKFKPMNTLIFGCVLGVLCCVTLNMYAIILGGVILAYSLFVYMNVKDYITLSIYETFVLVYAYESEDQVRVIKYEDVVEWGCKTDEGKSNAMMFRLNTGEVIYKDTFQAGKAFSALNKIMPERETRTMQLEEFKAKGKNYKFRLPFGRKKK